MRLSEKKIQVYIVEIEAKSPNKSDRLYSTNDYYWWKNYISMPRFEGVYQCPCCLVAGRSMGARCAPVQTWSTRCVTYWCVWPCFNVTKIFMTMLQCYKVFYVHASMLQRFFNVHASMLQRVLCPCFNVKKIFMSMLQCYKVFYVHASMLQRFLCPCFNVTKIFMSMLQCYTDFYDHALMLQRFLWPCFNVKKIFMSMHQCYEDFFMSMHQCYKVFYVHT